MNGIAPSRAPQLDEVACVVGNESSGEDTICVLLVDLKVVDSTEGRLGLDVGDGDEAPRGAEVVSDAEVACADPGVVF